MKKFVRYSSSNWNSVETNERKIRK